MSTPIGIKPETPPNRKQWVAYIIIMGIIILHTVIIIAFVIAFTRERNPKLRLSSANIENLTSVNSTNSPSFSIRLNAQVKLKNSNFGHFHFSDSTVSVLYHGTPIGGGIVPSGRAAARSTEKLNVMVAVAYSDRVGFLSSDLNLGKITLVSQATLNGTIHLFKVITRRNTATMNCTMDVNTRMRAVENLQCK